MDNTDLTPTHLVLDPEMVARLRRYRPRNLSTTQHTLYLESMCDVVLAAGPRNYVEARNWLSVLAAFVGEVATPATGTLDDVLSDAEISRWIGLSALKGRSRHTLKTRRGVLVRLVGARRGAMTSVTRSVPERRRAGTIVGAELATLLEGCNADSLSARRGALAHLLAGVPVGTRRTRFHKSASGLLVVAPSQSYPVPPSAIDLASVEGTLVIEEDWIALKDVARALGISISAVTALRSARAAALGDVSLTLAQRLTRYHLTEDGCTTALRAMDAPDDAELLVGRAILRDGTVSGECTDPSLGAPSPTPRPRGAKEAGHQVTRKTSRAAAKRLAAERLAQSEARAEGTQPIADYLATYVPDECDATWDRIAPTVRATVGVCEFQSVETARKHAVALNAYLRWRAQNGQSTDVATALAYGPIDEFFARGLSDLSERSRRDYRSRLRALAERANASVGAPPALRLGHNQVNAGYDATEERLIRRAALHQSKPEVRRRLCAVVGFCAGAGLSSEELCALRRRDVTIHDDGTIEIRVPGKRPRRTVVRRTYERHVAIALEGLADDEGVLPTLKSSSPITAMLKAAYLHGAVPAIDTRRLRTTWIGWLMDQRIPLALAVEASGLRSSRTFWDILSRRSASSDLGELREGGTK